MFNLLNDRKQADSAPLMTRAMREVREESEMYKYDKVGGCSDIHLKILLTTSCTCSFIVTAIFKIHTMMVYYHSGREY